MSIELTIEGMRCNNCASHVERALKGVAGVSGVAVSLKDKQAVVECDEENVTPQQLIRAIEDEGFGASEASASR